MQPMLIGEKKEFFMAKALKLRVQAFLKYVEETEDPNVVREFNALFNANENPNDANLFLLLGKAKQIGSGAGAGMIKHVS